MTDVFTDALRRLDEVADLIEVDPEVLERLRHPKSVMEVAIPIRRDDGSLKVTLPRWGSIFPTPSRPN